MMKRPTLQTKSTEQLHRQANGGLRLSAGTIMLQGHDPTTDVLFGEISAAELLLRR